MSRLRTYREAYPPVDERGFIFRTKQGSPLDPDNWFRRGFVPITIAAGLRPADTRKADDAELVGLHTLHHTYASMLIAQGENFKYVSRQIGHANIAITLNTYSHLLKETSTSAMARVAMRISATDTATVLPIATGTHGGT